MDTLDELRVFLMDQSVQPTLSANDILNAQIRVATFEEAMESIELMAVMNADDTSDELFFTQAGLTYLLRVVAWVQEDESERSKYIHMNPDEEGLASTFVDIFFPPHLEPPLELP